MTNEDLLKFLQDTMGKYFTTVQVPPAFSGQELYELFKTQKINTLPFLAKIEGHTFTDVAINFIAVQWEKKVMEISSTAEFAVDKVYPIPVSYLAKYMHPSFAPLLNPIDPKLVTSKPFEKNWHVNRMHSKGGASDKLSIYFNNQLDIKKLVKSYDALYGYQEGQVITTFAHPESIGIYPVTDRPGLVRISVHEFMAFHPKKDNFFPKHDFNHTWGVIDLLVNKYKEFINTVDFAGYPKDPYLTGPEAFVCKKCESLVFPNSLFLQKIFVAYIYRKQVDSTPVDYVMNAVCPNCGTTREVLSHRDDKKTLQTATELFWVCPKDLAPYNILKQDTKKDKVEYQVNCPICGQKVKKELGLDFKDTVEPAKGAVSPHLQKRSGLNFVEYKT